MTEEEAVNLTLKTLLEVVESGANSMELMVLKKGAEVAPLPHAEVERLVAAIEAEDEA